MECYGRTDEEWGTLEAAGWEFLVSQACLLISVLVQYLNANDASPGFYDLAQRKNLLPPHPSKDDKLVFWVRHLQDVYAHTW